MIYRKTINLVNVGDCFNPEKISAPSQGVLVLIQLNFLSRAISFTQSENMVLKVQSIFPG